jgi:hypothetical protein
MIRRRERRGSGRGGVEGEKVGMVWGRGKGEGGRKEG